MCGIAGVLRTDGGPVAYDWSNWLLGPPADLKLRGLHRKHILKQAMKGQLPHEVIWRKKAGFGAPIRAWLRNDLQPMIDDLLSAERIKSRGLFNPLAVQRLLEDNRSGRADNALKIWQLLTLELWLEQFIDGRGRRSKKVVLSVGK